MRQRFVWMVAAMIGFGSLLGCGSDPQRPAATDAPQVGDVVDAPETGHWPLDPTSVGFGDDGRTVAAGCGGLLCRWGLDDDTADAAGVAGPALSADAGRTLLPRAEHVLVVDTATREVTAVFSEHEAVFEVNFPPISAVALSPDGELAASVGLDGAAYLWRVADGSVAHRLDVSGGDFAPPIFSPDGRSLALGFTTGLGDEATQSRWIVDTARGEVTHEVDDVARFQGWSPDGRWLVGTQRDGRLGLWETDDYQQVRSTALLSNGPAAFSPDSRTLAFVDRDDPAALRLWRLDDAEDQTPVETIPTAHPDDISGLAWTPDGTAVATASTEFRGFDVHVLADFERDDHRDVIVVHEVATGEPLTSLALP